MRPGPVRNEGDIRASSQNRRLQSALPFPVLLLCMRGDAYMISPYCFVSPVFRDFDTGPKTKAFSLMHLALGRPKPQVLTTPQHFKNYRWCAFTTGKPSPALTTPQHKHRLSLAPHHTRHARREAGSHRTTSLDRMHTYVQQADADVIAWACDTKHTHTSSCLSPHDRTFYAMSRAAMMYTAASCTCVYADVCTSTSAAGVRTYRCACLRMLTRSEPVLTRKTAVLPTPAHYMH